MEQKRAALLTISNRWGPMRSHFATGNWCYRSEVASILPALWDRPVLRVTPERKARQWRFLFAATGEVAIPVSNTDVPALMCEVDPPIARHVVRVLYQKKLQAFTLDCGRRPGPIIVSL